MDKQGYFDKIAKHLLTQKKQALRDDGQCAYRAADGCECAIGCIIPDDKYSPSFEGNGIWYKPVQDAIGVENTDIFVFFIDMQRIHDGWIPEYWFWLLLSVAEQNSLDMSVLNEFWNNGEGHKIANALNEYVLADIKEYAPQHGFTGTFQ